MRCRDVQPALPGLISDALPAAQAAALRDHLATCPACRRLVALYRQDRAALQAFLRAPARPPAPHQSWAGGRAARARRGRWPGAAGWARAAVGPALALLLVGVVALAAYGLLGGAAGHPREGATPAAVAAAPPAATAASPATPVTLAGVSSPATQAAACTPTHPRYQGAWGAGPIRTNYGEDGLWTDIPPEGVLVPRFGDGTTGGALLQPEWIWWQEGRARGELTIGGRRLDAPAPPLRAEIAEGYGFDIEGVRLATLIFPSEGCWEVTARSGEASLTFVLQVVRYMYR